MDRTERYRLIVEKLIEEYASFKPSHGQIETEAIVDQKRDHYEVMHVGWDGARRVHGCVVHVDIRDGKVWIQYDGTSRPVAEELLEAGIPREDIVLGFHPANVRKLTAFAPG
jgi:XisI protein